MGNLKLEVGKFYRTRNGLKGECVFFRRNSVGVNKHYSAIVLFEDQYYPTYTETGCFFASGQQHELDIISEWEETPEEIFKRIGFDPDCLPAWANWIAMYKSNKWAYFENEPEEATAIFYAEKGHASYIPDKYAPKNYTGDWKDSKFKVK